VIITDLDGSLLSEWTYEAGPALDVLRRAVNFGVPVCVCSSKTSREIERINQKLELRDPFICENGGAIFIPTNYFTTFPAQPTSVPHEYEVIELGLPYSEVRAEFERVSAGLAIHALDDFTEFQLSSETGLTPAEARLALGRYYDVPFRVERKEDVDRMRSLLTPGFAIARGGRYFHLTGKTDKGLAVRELLKLFRSRYPNIVAAAIGDSENDVPMFREVNIPVLIAHAGVHDFSMDMELPNLRRTEGIGPLGWQTAVNTLLEEWMGSRKEQQFA
jgi:mannosyl-3-phosphoglycerate phosphatase